MAKNIRSGLAIGAAASLVLAGFGAAPASAAISKITLAPLVGTSTNAALGTYFAIKATAVGATGNNIAFTIGGDVTDADVADVRAAVIGEDSVASYDAGDATAAGLAPAALTAAAFAPADAGGNVNADDEIVISSVSVAANQVDAAEPYVVLGVALDDTVFEDRTSLTIRAFEDTNDNGVRDADLEEYLSAAMTVTFLPLDEVSVTASQSVNVVANTSEVTVALNNVNMASTDLDQSATLVDMLGWVNGAADADVDTFAEDNGTDVVFADYDSDENAYVTTVAFDTNIDASDVVTVKVYLGDEEADAAAVLRSDLAASDVDSYGLIDIADSQFYVEPVDADDYQARSGDGSFVATVKVKDDTGYGIAGEVVTWTLTEGALTNGVVTAGGEELADGDDPITVTATTNASGTASLTISYEDFDAGESFEIDAVVKSANAAAPTQVTVTSADADDYNLVWNYSVDDADVINAVYGGSSTVTVALRDNFGLPPAADARVRVNISGTNTEITRFIELNAAGNGSYTFTNDEDADGTIDLVFLDIVDGDSTDGDNDIVDFADSDGDWGDAFLDSVALEVVVSGQDEITVVESLDAVAKVKIDDANSHDSDTEETLADVVLSDALVSYTALPQLSGDARVFGGDDGLDVAVAATLAALTAGVVASNTIDVDVLSSDNLAVSGAPVTFSATGVLFYNANEDIYGWESLTLHSDANGNAVAHFASTVAGDSVVTVTSNGKSDTITIGVDPAPEKYGWSLDVSSNSAYAAPGSTYVYTAILRDRNGNPVDTGANVDVTYDGPGLVVGTLPDETNSSGKLTFNVLLGANDTGTGTVNFAWSTTGVDGAADGGDDVDIDIDTVFTVGTDPAASVATWTKNLGSGEVKMYAKNIVGAGKVQFMLNGEEIAWVNASSSADSKLRSANGFYYLVRTVELVEGQKNVLEIYVDGVRTTRTAYTY